MIASLDRRPYGRTSGTSAGRTAGRRTEKRNNKCIYLCLSVEKAPYEANHVESRCKKRNPDVRSQTDGQALAFLLHASIENSPAARRGAAAARHQGSTLPRRIVVVECSPSVRSHKRMPPPKPGDTQAAPVRARWRYIGRRGTCLADFDRGPLSIMRVFAGALVSQQLFN